MNKKKKTENIIIKTLLYRSKTDASDIWSDSIMNQ